LAFVLLITLTQPVKAVVGYVNLTITNGYNFLANPLNSTNNTLTNLIQNCPDNTEVYLWDVGQQTFAGPATFQGVDFGGWDTNFDLPPGKGFLVVSDSRWTNTFVGEVLQGSLTNFVAGTNRFSLLGSMVPQAAPLSGTNNLQFPGGDGDTVYFFPSSSGGQTFSEAYSYFGGFGWFDPRGIVGTNGPVLQVGQSFFVQVPGSSKNWIRQFTVQLVANKTSLLTGQPTPGSAEIGGITVRNGEVTLSILNSTGQPYSIQFSPDQVSWKTISTNQTGQTWTGPLSRDGQGYYRVSSP
jgi:hypothetical protein